MSELRAIRGRVRTKDLKPPEEGGYTAPHPIVVHPPNGGGGSVPVTILTHDGDSVGGLEPWMVEWLRDKGPFNLEWKTYYQIAIAIERILERKPHHD